MEQDSRADGAGAHRVYSGRRPTGGNAAGGAPIYPGPFYVWFASGGAEIEGPGARMLDYAVSFYADLPARCAVTVIGHADPSDLSGAHAHLGARGAKAVAAYLAAHGVGSRIRTMDRATRVPFVAELGDRQIAAKNRRVEVGSSCTVEAR